MESVDSDTENCGLRHGEYGLRREEWRVWTQTWRVKSVDSDMENCGLSHGQCGLRHEACGLRHGEMCRKWKAWTQNWRDVDSQTENTNIGANSRLGHKKRAHRPTSKTCRHRRSVWTQTRIVLAECTLPAGCWVYVTDWLVNARYWLGAEYTLPINSWMHKLPTHVCWVRWIHLSNGPSRPSPGHCSVWLLSRSRDCCLQRG